MEACLSLVTVVIMCVPGLAFLVKMWRKKSVRQTRRLGNLPVYEQRTWPVTWPQGAISHPLPKPHRAFRREELLLAPQILNSRSMPDLGCIDSVSNPWHQARKAWCVGTFLIYWQDTTTISLPKNAHVRPESLPRGDDVVNHWYEGSDDVGGRVYPACGAWITMLTH